MIGYIAPSFAFYPYGIYSKGYGSTKNDSQVGSIIKQLSKIGIGSTPQNIDVGSQICKEMCSKTGCLALETEVTENCIFDDTCVNQSEASCSLYFESVDHADKAYYTISKVNRDMVGRKYYENNTFPDASPDTRYSIDDSPVKWCSTANAEYVNLSNKFETIIGAKAKCTCNNNTQNCDDTNCCKVRNLVTLSGVKLSAPFYQLPFNKRTNELLDAKNSDGSCCGKCTINGITRYISCIGDKGDGWNLAPTANCSSYKPYKDLSSSDKKQLDQDYKEALSNNTLDDFSRTNCTARYETAELKTVQPDCMDNNNWSYNNIRHGCKGGPTVIAADFLINGMPCTSIPGELKCSTSGEMCSDKLAMYCDENSTPLFQPSSN
jgi:hypothetical protein